MRPLRLRIGGFTCFRDEQHIDFSGLELFAIAGPTGAGKSTILDAIVFALYGEVPRIAADRLGELVSLGLERAVVGLDFEVGAAAYRVTRGIARDGARDARLERLDGGAACAVVEGGPEVVREVRRLLGIDAAAFLKAVVLPQGRFADFLHSRPEERRGMLRSLLQLEVYERMRERALELARGAAQRAEGLRGRLHEDFADATDERLAAIGVRLDGLAARVHSSASAAEAAWSRFAALERGAELARELRAARAHLAALEEERGAVVAREQARDRSERARSLVGLVELAARARARHDEARVELARWGAPVESAARRRDAAEAAEAASRELEGLRAALERLGQVTPLLARRVEWARRFEEADWARSKAELEIEAWAMDLLRCKAELAGHVAELQEVERALAGGGYDPERLRRLCDALAPAAELVARDRDLQRAHEQVGIRDAELSRAVAAQAEARVAAMAAAQHVTDAAEHHERACVALEAARRVHAAHELRAALAPGAPCPVCARPVEEVVGAGAPADLEVARAREATARRRRGRCAQLEQHTRAQLAVAERVVAQAVIDRDAAVAKVGVLARDVEALADRLAAVLEERAGGTVAMAERIPALCTAERGRADHQARLERRKHALERAAGEAGHREALATQRILVGGRDRVRARLAAAEASSEIATLEAELRELIPSGDAEHERGYLARRIATLTAERDAAIEEEHHQAQALHDRAARAAVARAACEVAAAEAVEAEARARAGLEAGGFVDERDVRAALLTPEQRDEIDRAARQWLDDHAAAIARVADLTERAGETEVTAEATAAARAAADAARAQHDELVVTVGRLGSERGEVERRIARASELRRQLAEQVAVEAIHGQLADDLRFDRLQAHVLEGAFREIVAAASVRLRELSGGRYALGYGADEFHVVDHLCGRGRRRVDTLSGGETFLTALSLALALSEQVQRAAGAVRLDSLFIDEGLGTLDRETLATVTDAIHRLGRAHRMVGVITHAQELTRALPARIEVHRGSDGSRIEVVARGLAEPLRRDLAASAGRRASD
ncbi:MAG TPA: SMC family ATPase [Kofleriaceae bacterium]|nr:SMC family ATPase [Kofleriaceae bacterium]